jgi:hypothetical protein
MKFEVWERRIRKVYARVDSQGVRNRVGSSINSDV